MKKIAWIGTGVMGKPMAYHLADAGHDVTVFNRTYEKAATMSDKCTVAKTIKEAVLEADVVFSIVGFPQDVRDIYLSDEGILNNVKPGTIVVDLTTSSPTLAKEIYVKAKEKNVKSLDSPVTGGDLGAKNATLSVMVGGDEQAYHDVYPYLDKFAKAITYMGESGNGQYAKLANQICIAGAISTTAEALNFAVSKGLNPEKMLNVINNGSAQSWQSINMGPKMIENDYDPGFFIKHFIKDLRLGQEERGGEKLSVSQLVLEQYEELLDKGYGDFGTQAIFDFYQKKKLHELD